MNPLLRFLLDVQEILRRAMNTWEPSEQPRWLLPFADLIDDMIKERQR